MRGDAVKCDNCGDVEFFLEPETSRYGKLAFIFKDYTTTEEELPTTPSKWLSVAREFYNPKFKTVDTEVKHFCSTECLEFSVRYIYNNKDVPTTQEGEK